MDRNFYAGCHVCKVRVFLYRGKESKPMHDFFRKHDDCLRYDAGACVVASDGAGEQDWMNDYSVDMDIQDDDI